MPESAACLAASLEDAVRRRGPPDCRPADGDASLRALLSSPT